MGSVPTSLGEWIHSLGLTWTSGVERVPPQGAPGACGGQLLLGFRLFGLALHREPKGTKRDMSSR